jgi:mannose-6-phosphate isomerase
VFEWLISGGHGIDALVGRVVSIARANPEELATIVMLADAYPGDPGIVISVLLHRVTLCRGEALYLPAGNIHAYLSGLGVELMGASDNVLRGGLTRKHVDVRELVDVLDFRPVPVPYLLAESTQPSTEVFRPDVPDFRLERIVDEGVCSLSGPAILICIDGSLHIQGSESAIEVARGDCFFVTPAEVDLMVTGHGTVFVATTGL